MKLSPEKSYARRKSFILSSQKVLRAMSNECHGQPELNYYFKVCTAPGKLRAGDFWL